MNSTGASGASGGRIKVLVVEDEATIAGNLLQYLELRAYEADIAYDGPAAMVRIAAESWDVIILDIGLPRADGFQVIHHLRETLLLPTPVLILTARSDLDARLQGFSLGADDYLQKPFALAELTARLRALLRRGAPRESRLRVADLEIDTVRRIVTRSGRTIEPKP